MTAVPVTRVFVAGEVVLASYFNTNINGPLAFLLAPPILRARQIVGQGITTSTFAPVTFTAEDVDSSGMHSTSVNTSRATAVYPGWYTDSGAVTWPASATGQRLLRWTVTGVDVSGSDSTIQGFATLTNRQVARTIKTFLNVGDYLEMTAWQNSGGTLTTDVTAAGQSTMDVDFKSN